MSGPQQGYYPPPLAAPWGATQDINYLHGLHSKSAERAAMLKRILIGFVVLLVILIIFQQGHHHSKKLRHKHHKNNFENKVGVRKHNNLNTGGMNSHWWHGGGDAGHGGSVHRVETDIHKAVYAPHLYQEGLVASPTGQCQPGENAMLVKFPPHQVQNGYDNNGQPVYVTVPGGTTTQCVSTSARPVAESGLGDDDGLGKDPSGAKWRGHDCPPWDPEATAEVQALGQVGGFQNDNAYGERRLQRAFGLHITDEQLNSIMHQ